MWRREIAVHGYCMCIFDWNNIIISYINQYVFGYMNLIAVYINISILVDPASSYMLVSKIKPCMSKYTRIKSETAKGSLYQLWFIRSLTVTWITVVILELIHAI